MEKIIDMVILLLSCRNSGSALQPNNPKSNKLLSDWIHVHLNLVRTTKDIAHAAYAAMLKYFYGNNSDAALIDSLEKVNNKWLVKNGFHKE